jgi:hypothetical protein
MLLDTIFRARNLFLKAPPILQDFLVSYLDFFMIRPWKRRF